MGTTGEFKTYIGTCSQSSQEMSPSGTVRTCGLFKSPGPDGIYPALLQKAEEEILGLQTRPIRARLTLGYVSEAWRDTRVLFKLKARRSSYNSPKDFKQISLTSFILIAMKKIIDRYLRNTELIR